MAATRAPLGTLGVLYREQVPAILIFVGLSGLVLAGAAVILVIEPARWRAWGVPVLAHRRLRLGAAAGSALMTVTGGAFVGYEWHDSRLPDRYSVMDFGAADYGGGPADGHAVHRLHGTSLHLINGPRDERPDFRRTLVARKAQVTLASGRKLDAWTFDGRVPGPELRIRAGDLAEITLVNRDIADGVSIHWHGLDVPNAEDGVSGVTQDAVMPGERFTYRFRAEQIGTFWYHSHQISSTEVRRGLYGPLVIVPRRPAEPEQLDLAVVAHTFPGAVALGRSDGVERHVVDAGTPVRLRLINSDSSLKRFALAGTPFEVAAVDGTDVNRPTPLEDRLLELGAGGRYDVRFTMPDAPVRLELLGTKTALTFSDDGRGDVAPVASAHTFDPAGYGREKREPVRRGSRFDRRFELTIGRRIGFLDGRIGNHWTINGKIFPDVPMFHVREGETVRITMTNETGAAHPMHLHGHHVRVLSRNGRPVTGSPWWVDTLNVLPHERYEVAFRAANAGLWMLHCHNLPHARDGLTMHLVYDGVTTPYRIGGAAGNHPE